LDPFVPIKKIENKFDSNGVIIEPNLCGTNMISLGSVQLKLEYSVGILRCPDQKFAEFFKESNEYFCAPYESDDEMSSDKYWTLEPCAIRSVETSVAPMNATYGSPLFRCYFPSNGYTGIDFGVHPTFCLVPTDTCDGTAGISGLALTSYFADDEGDAVAAVSQMLEGKDVTFAHFLEGLDKWFTA